MEPADAHGYLARLRPVLGLGRPWVLRGAVFYPSPWVKSRRPTNWKLGYRGLPQPSFATQNEEDEYRIRGLRKYDAYRAASGSALQEKHAEQSVAKADRTNRWWYVNRLREIRRRIHPRYEEYKAATAALVEFVARAAVAYTPSTLDARTRAMFQDSLD